ncbi:exonuclease, partial [Klebsiella pneumoniae]
WLMMSLWDALRMNMMISYQELVRTFLKPGAVASLKSPSAPQNVFFERL